jgi:glc operon protein GlcG
VVDRRPLEWGARGQEEIMRMKSLVAIVTLALPFAVAAQTPPPAAAPSYGKSVGLEQALKVAAAAIAEASKNSWQVVVTIVDASGNTVLVVRMDDAQFGSIVVSRQKAWSAVAFRRPTKAFEDALAEGGVGLRILKIEGAAPVEGGLPLIVQGKIVGAIGVSGVKASEDGQIAKAGADSLH